MLGAGICHHVPSAYVVGRTGDPATGRAMRQVPGCEAEFNVSQITARGAYQVLIADGLVEGRFGAGYYVHSYRPIIRYGIQRLAPAPRKAGLAV